MQTSSLFQRTTTQYTRHPNACKSQTMRETNTPTHTPWSRALNRVISTTNITTAELAEVGECSVRHIQNIAAGTSSASEELSGRINRYLTSPHIRETRTAQTNFDPSWRHELRSQAIADGRIEDESNEMMILAGAIAEAHADRDGDRMERRIRDMEILMERYRAERGLLK